MTKKNFIKLVVSIAAPFLAGGIGSFFTMPAIPGWYAELAKPALNPPSWVFGPVWTLLYILIGVSFFLVWQRGFGDERGRRALAVFIVQLALNAIWSVVFFGLQSPGAALIIIAALWLSIIWMAYEFYHHRRLAAYLLIPYLLWVSFASYLNYAIWVLN
jgi:translocator protein